MKYFLICIFLVLAGCSKSDKGQNPKLLDSNPKDYQATWNLSSIEVGDLDFGLVEYDQQRILTVDIVNDGSESVQGVVELDGADFSLLFSNCSMLIPLQKCYVKLGFSASDKEGSSYTANLSYAGKINVVTAQINRSNQNSSSYFYSNGLGIDQYSFGTINHSHSLLKSFFIRNNGSNTLNEEVSLVGHSSFSKVYDVCSNKDIIPGRSCLVKVLLNGQGQSGELSTVLSYGEQLLPINGSVKNQEQLAQENSEFIFIYNNLDHSSTPINLETVNLEEVKEYRFYVKNIGSSPGFINQFSLASSFNVFYNNCQGQLIYPNQSCYLRAHLDPPVRGSFSTQIQADVDYQINSQSIQYTVRAPGDKIACTNEIENAQLANISWTGSEYSGCMVEECLSTHHIFENQCRINVIECSVPHGSGTRTWSSNLQDYQECIVDSCESSSYEIVNNSCEYVDPIASNLSFSLDEDTNLINQNFNFQTATGSATVEIVTPASSGLVTVVNNQFSYNPNNDFNGIDSFSYRVFDGQVYSNTASVTLTINPINDAPLTQGQNLNINEDSTLNISLLAQDVDSSVFGYQIIESPIHGTLTQNGNQLVYVPNVNYNGNDSFSYKANDGYLDSNHSTVSIVVNAENDAPEAQLQNLVAQEDTALPITLSGSDVENDSLTYTLVSPPTHGTLTGTIPNYVYTPDLNYNGPDTFSFKVNDGQSDSAVVSVVIEVAPINDAPIAQAQTIEPVTPGGNISGALSGSDIEDNALTYSVVETTSKGSLTLDEQGNYSYIPQANTSGYDEFTFKVNDGDLDSAVKKVQVHITPVDVSCEAIKARGYGSGYYGIDLDGLNQGNKPVSLYCEFNVEAGNVWTQVAKVNLNQPLWNAWSNNFNSNKIYDTESFGVAVQDLTNNSFGRDLEVLVKVDGVYKNIIYYDVNLNKAFNPTLSTGASATVQQGIFYRSFAETNYTRCENTFTSSNAQWNWSIADSQNSTCGGYSSNGGFIVVGAAGTTEQANLLYGLNQYNGAGFSNFEIYVRKKTLTYPISCQHGYDNGIVTSSTLYTIDVDSNGTGQTIHCEVIGGEAYTLLANFGNNSRYSNRGVLRNGVTTTTQAQVTSAGFSTNATSWNHGDYPTSSSYIQYFLGGSSTGYVRIRGPKWGGEVRTLYQALNGAGLYARLRIYGNTRDNNFGVIQGNSSTTVTTGYIYKNADTFSWDEYTSSVFGLYYIFIK